MWPVLKRQNDHGTPASPINPTARLRSLVLVTLVIAAVVSESGQVAHAHQSSVTYSDVRLNESRQSLEYQLRISIADIAEPAGLAPGTRPGTQDILRAESQIYDYVLTRIALRTSSDPCGLQREPLGVDEQYAIVRWHINCSTPIDWLVIDYDLFFDLDSFHNANLLVHVPGFDPANAVLSEDHSRFRWDDIDNSSGSGGLGFVASGVQHILFGFDHIAFLLALLAVVVLRRERDHWYSRDRGDTLRNAAFLVTTFTVAHSVTIVAASLGWLSINARLVESVIAASIVVVSVENVLSPQVRYRGWLTFVFGLVHGLGFASMLAVLLPPEHILVPVLAFNIGVELGQLVIVAVILPALYMLIRRVGAQAYRARYMVGLSAAIGVLGFVWLIERVFAVSILGL